MEHKPAQILLIDDNRDHLELMACLLKAFGHRPLSVGSGEGALGIALHTRIDLVVCDLLLARMTGFEVAEHFRASPELKSIPLVAVSALTADSVRKKALAAGFDGFIAKPISAEGFVFELQRLVKIDLTRDFTRPAAAGSPAIAPELHGTILAVDDKPANLDLARAMLEPFGFKVVTASGVREALACARRHPPSLILTDVHMGDGTGFDLVKTVRTDPQLQHIPCLVISATFLDIDPRAMDLDLDDDNFILRPIEPGALVAKIEACQAAWSKGVT